MAGKEKRIAVTLACEVCKRRNYITIKNKQNDRERIELKKYCKWDRQHTAHKETARVVRPEPFPVAAPSGALWLPWRRPSRSGGL